MNLLNLTPDIQETILFLPRTLAGRATITERDLRSVAGLADWTAQTRAFGNHLGHGKQTAGFFADQRNV